ncbi:MAG: L,D-transpeptidase [Bdellovibrionota bacterium]
MKSIRSAFLLLLLLVMPALTPAFAQSIDQSSEETGPNVLDELDPFDPNIEEKLREYDIEQERATGMPSWIDNGFGFAETCFQFTCPVYALIVRSEQKLYFYVDGRLEDVWLVSTGTKGHGTPNFDRHPNGRIYDRYTSSKFPGGDYNGLGNMPYAVFISGGFAVHGTPQGNWSKLGTRASHGCVRVHPDNAYRLNRLVREVGVANTWITIKE